MEEIGMGLTERRKQVLDKMVDHSILVLYSGIERHVSADAYAHFEENRNFFYLIEHNSDYPT